MSPAFRHPWFHRLAVLTLCVALAPIVVGALVTTLGAGMAFPDWPSSDGHNMLLYPWLKSAGGKFVEHGHRLAGMLIGVVSIALAVTAWRVESRTWVKWLATGVLLGVCFQGWLGGQRVLRDARGLAAVHGSFAALVFSLMGAVVVVTSREWEGRAEDGGRKAVKKEARGGGLGRLRLFSVVTSGAIVLQYVLGGLVRHQGMMLHQHLGFAFVVALLVIVLASGALASGVAWIRMPAVALLLLTFVQMLLGAGAWITKYGFGDGYTVVNGAPLQVWMRTGHVLTGMLTLMTSVVLALRLFRLGWVQSKSAAGPLASPLQWTEALS